MKGALALVVVACTGLAACGSGAADSEADAKQTVHDFVAATNERDADAFCGELVSQEFLEQATGAKGDKAGEACRKLLKNTKDPRVRLIRIKKTDIDGDTAKVTAVIATQGQTLTQLLRLEQEDGRWKIAGGSGN